MGKMCHVRVSDELGKTWLNIFRIHSTRYAQHIYMNV